MLLNNIGTAKIKPVMVSGEGALLFDEDGKTYWDFYGGHAVTLIGLGHPQWTQAIADQAKKLSFFTTLGDVSVRTEAAHALCSFTGMDQAFFVNSGSEANEAALKIARKATGRPVIIAMKNGFHGRTMGSLGVTWKYRDQHAPAHGQVRFVPFDDLAALKHALDGEVAAVITEPVQGMAGVVTPRPGWLSGVQALCKANGSLLIADEIQAGIGRMGVALASHRDGVVPDIATVGKGVGGGFPVAAMLCSDAVAATVKPGEHGTTFGGGPLACAAVVSTLKIIRDEELLTTAGALGAALKGLCAIEGVKEVRGAGAWAGIVLDRPARPVAAALRERGFLVGTSSDPCVLRVAPPAAIPLYVVRQLSEALSTVLGPAVASRELA